MPTRHLRISGRVQGVSYRAWMTQTANSLGVSGWVRNRADGTVEALVNGPEDTLQNLIEYCREGPPAAHVEKIEAKEQERYDGPDGFEQKPSF